MNCENCGGPMAFMPKGEYFFCEYCSSIVFAEKNSDGVAVVEPDSEFDCPVCRSIMATASLEGRQVWHCLNCRGVLTQQATFLPIINTRAARIDPVETPKQPITAEELERVLSCPSCKRKMEAHPYYGPGHVLIDTCGKCGLIWLDHGEIETIVNAHRLEWR
ncbi:zf-TFIIB domain-containing protein [Candidatus Sumerlaeota bacterium]|nr:zf-TFIIB domain-containing protein [Candidatus Sumerlaeota bacterium]